ncbi:MAG: hypothetical protein DYG94_13505 [Leptolyngbya sp. PLA3]|nr:MAG: hypothetical protein EDM82_14060 [Cyanobacteria bacterium CYA]MCE7969742.1 hypothetical protein [Leptolyngbya sp. PL-A3]
MLGIGAGVLALCCGAALGQVQEKIDAAFALQKDGATLAVVRAALANEAGDEAVQFAIASVDFLMAGEGLLQAAHRHGFLSTLAPVSGMVGRRDILAWIFNGQPAPTTFADIDAAVQGFVDALGRCEAQLGDVGDFKCAINVPQVRFDVNSDGKAEEKEAIGALLGALPGRWEYDAKEERYVEVPLLPEEFTIAFDHGDASWLRGYCHLLMGVGQVWLAHDGQEWFDRTGLVLFPDAQIRYDFLKNSTFFIEAMGDRTPTPFDVTDLIAMIGNFEMPVDEPERMKAALEHFRATVVHGKEMWGRYDAETDDDREWIPNPGQHAGVIGVEVDAEMREAWLMFLDECDDLLAGRKVLRFWRGDGSKGIDLVKVFEEPREFDLLYWIQGSAAAPYLKAGQFTSDGTWERLLDVFDERVFRFSFWFN